jgi:polar amino acid transport system permease protein
MIGMFKDSPLLFTIGVAELLSHAMTEGGNTYQYTEPILMVGAFFLIMSLASALILSRLNRRLSRAPS